MRIQAGCRLGTSWLHARFQAGDTLAAAGMKLAAGWVHVGFRLAATVLKGDSKWQQPDPSWLQLAVKVVAGWNGIYDCYRPDSSWLQLVSS